MIAVAALAFAVVRGTAGRWYRQQAPIESALSTTVSERAAAVGVTPGRQAWVYFFGSARCRSCSSPAMQRVISNLRTKVAEAWRGSFDTVRVIGVAVHTDIGEGLRYLRTFGDDAFDEISVGGGWENQNIAHFTRLFDMTAAAPQLVVISRSMSAHFAPFRMEITPDTVRGVLLGNAAIQRWSASQFAFSHLAQTISDSNSVRLTDH
jgi:hypothetical protein